MDGVEAAADAECRVKNKKHTVRWKKLIIVSLFAVCLK